MLKISLRYTALVFMMAAGRLLPVEATPSPCVKSFTSSQPLSEGSPHTVSQKTTRKLKWPPIDEATLVFKARGVTSRSYPYMRTQDSSLRKFPSRPTQAYQDPDFWYKVTGNTPTQKKTFPPKEELIKILKAKGINSHGYKSLRKQDPDLHAFPSYPAGAYHDPRFWYKVTGNTPQPRSQKAFPPVEETISVFKTMGVNSKSYPYMRRKDPSLRKFPSRPTQAYQDPDFWYKVTGNTPTRKKTFPPKEEIIQVFKAKGVLSHRYAGMRKVDPELKAFPFYPNKVYQDPAFWYKVTGNIPTRKKTFPPKEKLIKILKAKGINSHGYKKLKKQDSDLHAFPVHPAIVYKDPHFWRKVTGKKPFPPAEKLIQILQDQNIHSFYLYGKKRTTEQLLKDFPSVPEQAYQDPLFWDKVNKKNSLPSL